MSKHWLPLNAKKNRWLKIVWVKTTQYKLEGLHYSEELAFQNVSRKHPCSYRYDRMNRLQMHAPVVFVRWFLASQKKNKQRRGKSKSSKNIYAVVKFWFLKFQKWWPKFLAFEVDMWPENSLVQLYLRVVRAVNCNSSWRRIATTSL